MEATQGSAPGADPAGAAADFNVAPTKAAPVVLERLVDRSGEVATETETENEAGNEAAGEASLRWLRLLTWGLVPSWAKDRSIASRMINARAETLLDKSFRRAALNRRCLVPADGWYEWQVSPTERDVKGKPRKQPFFMQTTADDPLAFAGIYEFWRDSAVPADHPAAWLTTFAVITTAAEPGLAAVHDRMPFAMPPGRWAGWLDPTLREPDAVRALLEPPPAGRFRATPVSAQVNAVANNGPELVREVPREQLRGVLDPATGELLGPDAPLF